MTHTIDGFSFEIPPTESQIIALAQFHRKQLDEAIYHQEIRLGDYCLSQRKRVHDYTKILEPMQKLKFYKVYDGELKRLADDDNLHPTHAEAGVSIFAVSIVLIIIAIILYFAVIKALTH